MEGPLANLFGGFHGVATTICLRHIGETSQPNPRVVCPMALTGRLPPSDNLTSRLDIRMIRLAVGVALALVALSRAGSQ
jgi:hypothetical protein